MKYLIYTTREGGEYKVIKDDQAKVYNQVIEDGVINENDYTDGEAIVKVYFAASVEEIDNFDFVLNKKR